MADKSFGVQQLDIIGTGTPTIQSPNDLNINADTVAISTSLSIGNRVNISSGIITASSGIVTYYGDGSNLTGISGGGDKISEGNTEVETIDTGSDGHIKFTTEGTERVRIDSDGKFGIGMSSDQKTGGLKGKLDIDASGINAAGDTDDPNDYAIVIRNPQTTDSGNGIAFTNDGGSHVGGAIIHIDKGSNNIGDLAFLTSATTNTPTERLRITSSGDVGIGNTVPAGKLHLSSGTSGDCVLIIEADTDNNNEDDNGYIEFRQDGGLGVSAIGQGLLSGNQNGLVLANSVSTGYISFATGTTDGHTNATERLRINPDGKVVIGNILPNANLHIASGSSSAVGDATNPAFQIGNTSNYRFAVHTTNEQAVISNKSGDDGIAFHTQTGNNGSFGEAVRIESDGKVGIGSENPGATLDLQSSDAEILLRLNTKPTKNGYLDIVSDANRRGVIRFKDTDGTDRWSIGNGDSDELSNTSFHISSGNSGGGNAKLVIGSSGQIGLGGANYGTSGQVLTSNGSGSAPTWQTVSSGATGVSTTSGTFTVNSGVTTNIDSFAYASNDYKVAEYTLHFMNGANIQAQKLLVMQDGTNVYSNSYGVMSSSDLLVSIGSSIGGGNVYINATTEAGVSGITTYRWRREVQE